jgi:hypothetical protein
MNTANNTDITCTVVDSTAVTVATKAPCTFCGRSMKPASFTQHWRRHCHTDGARQCAEDHPGKVRPKKEASVTWTVGPFVTLVKELGERYECPVYNEATLSELRRRMQKEGATTELPEHSPTELFFPDVFAWQMVDPDSKSYYPTADACQRAVELLDEETFVQLCEDKQLY